MKYLIPIGSLTNDLIGTQRFMEVNDEESCTSQNIIVICRGKRFDTKTPINFWREKHE
jgi:hypothetical protein